MGGLSGSDIRPGTVDKKAFGSELYPFDDFEFTTQDATDSYLELKAPRALVAFHAGRGLAISSGSPYAISPTARYSDYFITTGASDFTVNPAAVSSMRGPITLWKMDSGAGEIVFDPDGSETVTYPGGTSTTMRVGRIGQHATFLPAGSTWVLVSGVVQPVALEPDIGGGWHLHSYEAYNSDVADTNWHEVSLSGHSPSGCKLAKVSVETTGTNTFYVRFSESSGGTIRYLFDIPFANGYATPQFDVPLSNTLSFWFQGQDAGVGVLKLTQSMYCLGPV